MNLTTIRYPRVLARFGVGSVQRRAVALRLATIYLIAQASGDLSRFAVIGSFVTDKPGPSDVDVFLLMEDTFDASQLTGEARSFSSIRRPRPDLASACSGYVA
jgi:uncharacterized protein DUF6932